MWRVNAMEKSTQSTPQLYSTPTLPVYLTMSAEECPNTSPDGVDATAEELSKSALRDNISRKGKNAYYYAHAHKADGPKWNGKIEPQLLSTSSSNISTTPSATSTIASSKATLMAKSNITNYAFLDDGSKVKVYVNLPAVGECPDENINLEFTERSLCLTITNYVAPLSSAKKEKEVDDELLVSDTAPTEEKEEEEDANVVETNLTGEDRCLSFGKLYGDIEKATYKKKADKVILILKKKDDKTWSSVCA